MVLRRGLLAAFPALLSGCASWQAPGFHLPRLPPAPPGPYRLGPGDALNLRVFDQAQMSGSYHVDDGGNIDLPLLGLVQAGGLSTDALAKSIASQLQARQLILHPSVAVEIATYRPFYTLGEVTTPGPYPYRPGMTVLTAISIAGGFTYRAETAYVGVTRTIGSKAAQYRAPTTAMVLPGDVITVFERRF
ncbi:MULTISPECIES: polysaccharide biosynthesis/export family protein [Acidocella]|uniref:polysaccharide biosynthesis/export family protein n=1 Tax=Acidocella TaxID=50709 RepID=UPI00028DE412|nr:MULTISPECIES: polysaccharide biosynthesis/export family protein [Acidocella]EKM98841.1 polysaccharide export protein [Acidocella sp. MX-AZ02]